MITDVHQGIQISVDTNYRDDYSIPTQNHYLFSYTIGIKNMNDFPVQLLRRHWIIKDSVGETREVEGEGNGKGHNLFTLWDLNRPQSIDVPDATPLLMNDVKRSQLGIFGLFGLYFARSIKQQRRVSQSVLADLAVVLCAGVFLGMLYFDKSQGRGNAHLETSTSLVNATVEPCAQCSWLSLGDPAETFFGCAAELASQLPPVSLALGDQILPRGSMCCIAVGLTSVTAFMKVFSDERTVYFRENSGLAT